MRSKCVNDLRLISRMVMLHRNISIPFPPIMQVGKVYQDRYVMRPSKHPTVLHKRGRYPATTRVFYALCLFINRQNVKVECRVVIEDYVQGKCTKNSLGWLLWFEVYD